MCIRDSGGSGLGELFVPGSGFTLAKIKQLKKGRMGRFVGQVPDGEPFSAGSSLFGDALPLDAALYPRKVGKKKVFNGFVVGETLFSGGGSLDSILEWVKEAGAPGLYPQGFRNGLQLRGDRLFEQGDSPLAVVLGLLGSEVRMEFKDGDLNPADPDAVLVAEVKITLQGGKLKARVENSQLEGLTMKVSPATGMFSGAFTHRDPAVTKPVKFKGILRRLEDPAGRGAFRGPTNAGSVKVFKAS